MQPLRGLFVFFVLNWIVQRHHSVFCIIWYYTKHKEQLLDYFTQILSNQLLRMGSYSFLIVFVFKRINFRSVCEFFPILLSCKLNFAVYWKHLSSYFLHGLFYLFCFLSSWKNLYIVHRNINLFYTTNNIIPQHNQTFHFINQHNH